MKIRDGIIIESGVTAGCSRDNTWRTWLGVATFAIISLFVVQVGFAAPLVVEGPIKSGDTPACVTITSYSWVAINDGSNHVGRTGISIVNKSTFAVVYLNYSNSAATSVAVNILNARSGIYLPYSDAMTVYGTATNTLTSDTSVCYGETKQ